jgi:hypothetical protein
MEVTDYNDLGTPKDTTDPPAEPMSEVPMISLHAIVGIRT